MKEFKCSRCGYRWSGEMADICPNCHKTETATKPLSEWLFALRRTISRFFRRKKESSSESTADLLKDLWRSASTPIFVFLVFAVFVYLCWLIFGAGFP